MKAAEADHLGDQIAACIENGDLDEAEFLLDSVLSQRIPFTQLDRIGRRIGQTQTEMAIPLFNRLARGRKMGSWVVIASALRCRLPADTLLCLAQARDYVVQADVWYATDIFGERVAGPAVLLDFNTALAALTGWRDDANHWARRCIGVAVHLWAKRKRGVFGTEEQAGEILAFLEPVFEESDPDAVKGVGWGLKTMGRYYPDLAAAWLEEQVTHRHKRPKATMLRKALTYLPPEQRARIKRGDPA